MLGEKFKPLGHRAYGSIPHLPGSKRGPGDHGISQEQADLAIKKCKNRHFRVHVQEKVDGTNVSIAKINGEIIPLVRAGYVANTSPFSMHHLFYTWALKQDWGWLPDNHRLCGEWILQAHGTRYNLVDGPFVAFDVMYEHTRLCLKDFTSLVPECFNRVHTFHTGVLSISDAMAALNDAKGRFGFHYALEPVEGAIWRVEEYNTVEKCWNLNFICKYVRPDSITGKYLPEISGEEVWNFSCVGS